MSLSIKLYKVENTGLIKINDIFDTIGFVPLRFLGIANGEITNNEKGTKVNLEVGIKPIYKYSFITSSILFSLVTLSFLGIDWKITVYFGLFSFIHFYGVYSLLMHGVSNFKSDLENDINYFEKYNR